MKTAFFRTDHGHIMFESVRKRDRYKSCERKAGYTNFAANVAINKLYKKEGVLLSTYVCPHCGLWHLTHKK